MDVLFVTLYYAFTFNLQRCKITTTIIKICTTKKVINQHNYYVYLDSVVLTCYMQKNDLI